MKDTTSTSLLSVAVLILSISVFMMSYNGYKAARKGLYYNCLANTYTCSSALGEERGTEILNWNY